jgi:transcriptional regulator with XRE-family HTH domain
MARPPAATSTTNGERRQAAALGEAVRRQRVERGLTLAALAAAVGISPSALSQIERGQVNPSVMTLRRIAAALGVAVFSLLPDDRPTPAVVVRTGERKTLGFPGSPVVYQLLTPGLDGSLEVLYYEIEVGGVTFEGGFAHEGEECCVVLRGKGRLELGGIEYELGEGDAATYSSGVKHALRNVGDEVLVAISCITPPQF